MSGWASRHLRAPPGLGFLLLIRERYGLVFPVADYGGPLLAPF